MSRGDAGYLVGLWATLIRARIGEMGADDRDILERGYVGVESGDDACDP